jgi:hypothetical protein
MEPPLIELAPERLLEQLKGRRRACPQHRSVI